MPLVRSRGEPDESAGEVVVLDSAGYGAFTADRTMTVQAAPGVYAGITASSGNAVQITAGTSDRIVLRGLTINGLGTAAAGIAFTGGGAEGGGRMEPWQNNKVRGNAFDYQGTGVLTRVSQQ